MLTVNNRLKCLIRDFIPKGFQVPLKYYYNRMNSTLESEMAIIQYFIKGNDRVIDVGGNLGIYTFHLWKLGARVETFEPNPACHSVLKAWASNKLGVNIHSVGLSNNAGSSTLHIPIDSSGVEHSASASIERRQFERARDQKIQLRTLDSYKFETVSLIKIDVEGHECSVLEGAKATLASTKPALLIEIEQRHKENPIGEVFEIITEIGYRGFFLEDSKIRDLKKFDPARHQSMDNFGGLKQEYMNNFLFLDLDKLDDGKYDLLFSSRAEQ